MSANEKTSAMLPPEGVVERLRATRAQIGEVTPLTAVERQSLRNRARASNPVLQASINMIGALDVVEQAVGQPADAVRQLYEETNRWTAVEDELRSMLSGVSGANLIRRQRLAFLAAQAYTIGTRLARDPAHAILVPHLQEIKRLKSFKRRRKAAGAAAPATPATVGDTEDTENSL
ncbi:MAG TPA: hypothetical protein VGQ46_16535 [Thermoanaerobaculia bacterium]|jgi:hypothetical protein|nr:hypothetical protein [Thermoanaerobaculia bacterium]